MSTGNDSKQQRTALVTGSSNGIGESVVKELAKLNYKLVVTGRNPDDISRVAKECAALSPSGTKPLEIVADLTNEPDVERLFELTMRYFDNKLNLLVNNAGINIPVPHTNPDECYAAYKRIMQINLHSAVRLSLLTASALKKTAEQSGETTSIVNVSSIAGCRPTPVYAAYGVSKAGMSMHTNYMSIELAPLVRVNSVAPGPVETKIIERSGWSMDQFKAMTNATAPLGRVGQPEEVAHSVLFLADPVKAAYITGAQLLIDGGVNQAPLQFS